MISAVFVFGPCHGKSFNMEEAKHDLFVFEDQDIAFDAYAHENIPMGMMSMPKSHTYKLYDVFDQGIEEVAIYFHNEDCCEKVFSDKTEKCRYQPIAMPNIFGNPARLPKSKGPE